MNVIGVVLRVVVFDQKGRTLDPVVMRIAFVDAARPGEMNLLQAGVADLLHLSAATSCGIRARYSSINFSSSAFVLVHLAGRDAFGFERVGFYLGQSENVGRRFLIEDGDGRCFSSSARISAAPVFFARQRAQSLPFALTDFGRVRAEGQGI